jgi:hypothetical protein
VVRGLNVSHRPDPVFKATPFFERQSVQGHPSFDIAQPIRPDRVSQLGVSAEKWWLHGGQSHISDRHFDFVDGQNVFFGAFLFYLKSAHLYHIVS